MLDQIIYTRCSKHRSLENGGREEIQDGSTVYSMSESVFTNYSKEELGFVEKILRKPNASSEREPIGLLTSYEYFKTVDGNKVVSRLDGRPMCTEKRKNGSANRGGTIINQTFLGNFEGYAFEIIDSPDWNAIQKPEIEYYHDDADETVPYLPTLNRDMYAGDFSVESIRLFISERKEAYKKALFFLMQQFSKDVSERKVLLIKDNPYNVAMWIAGLSLAMSTTMAEELTFSTNKSNLGMQTDTQLFYYVDNLGKIYYSPAQNQNMERKPYYMVVGFHPLDRFSKALREFPNSNYVILDGENLSFGIDDNFSAPNSIYFEHASELNMNINIFSDIILDNYSVYNYSDKIIDLYEAYYYLLSDNNSNSYSNYTETLKFLRILNSFSKSKDKSFDEKVFSRIMQVYPTKFSEDENNGYELVKELTKIANTPDKQREIINAIEKKIAIALEKMSQGENSIVGAWKSISDNDIGIDVEKLLSDVLTNHVLQEITNGINFASEDAVYTVLDMYIDMIERGIISYQTTCEDQIKYAFVIRAFAKIKDSENKITLLLKRISGSVELMAAILYSLENSRGEESIFIRAFIKVCPDINSVVTYYSKYSEANFNVVDIVLMTYILEKNECENSVLDCYFNMTRTMNTFESSNSRVFKAWYSLLEPSDLGRFFKYVYQSNFNEELKDELLENADNKLRYDEITTLSKDVVLDISNVATSKDIYSRTEEIFKLYTALKMKKKMSDLIKDMDKFSEAQFVFEEKEIQSKFIQTLFQIIAGHENSDIHYRSLFLFNFENTTSRNSYMKRYVEQIFKNASKNQILNQIISLSQVSFLIKNTEGDYRAMEISWENNLIDSLIPYYKPSMIEQIKKMSCDVIVQKNALALLEKVEAKAPKGLGGMINNIFGKFKK